MRIAIFTNLYYPIIDGITTSIDRVQKSLREKGHEVLIVAPTYDNFSEDEPNIHRVYALHGLSEHHVIPLPTHVDLAEPMDEFQPEIIHTHHSFMLGDSALRVASARNIPIVVTHHTGKLEYVNSLPEPLHWMANYAIELYLGHANLCNAVTVPLQIIKNELEELGVSTPIHVIPTGLDLKKQKAGNGAHFREKYDIPNDAYLIGTISRMEDEKNINFLLDCIFQTLELDDNTWAFIAGEGPSNEIVKNRIQLHPQCTRCIKEDHLTEQELLDAYAAFDVFATASLSETQGLTIIEAFAAGTPVVALDNPGFKESIVDGVNGKLIKEEDAILFSDTFLEMRNDLEKFSNAAYETAQKYDQSLLTDQLIEVYQQLIQQNKEPVSINESLWHNKITTFEAEWNIWYNRFGAIKGLMKQEY